MRNYQLEEELHNLKLKLEPTNESDKNYVEQIVELKKKIGNFKK